MELISTGISLGAWGGMAAGIGASFLLPRISFIRAAAIGGGSVIGSVAMLAITMFIASETSNDRYYSRNGVSDTLLNWSWVAFIPMVAVPYFAGVSAAAGVTLVALGILGAGAKVVLLGV